MLYLAEVKKQTKGFMGGSKTELKLVACQHGDDRGWKILSQEKLIAFEESNPFGDGTLVVVNLGQNLQIQGKIELATDRVIGILKTISRLLDKTQEQKEQIERWKESLTIQSEELSMREMELAARLERYEDMDERENPSESTNAHSPILSLDAIREQFVPLQAALNFQQANLDELRQQLERQENLPLSIEEIARQQQEIEKQNSQLHEVSTAIERDKTELLVQQKLLETKQSFVAIIKQRLQNLEGLEEKVIRLAIDAGSVELESRIDISALENMPLGELQEIVNKIQNELEKVVRFVNEQEEELTSQCQSIFRLQEKLNMASEYDRLSLEGELSDEQERKKMLDETLVGQRRNLRERQDVLRQYLRILHRRQGKIDRDRDEQNINLEPIVQEIKNQQADLQQKRQKLEAEIGQIQQDRERIQQRLQQQTQERESKQRTLQQHRENWERLKNSAEQYRIEVKIHRETIEPLQASVNEMRSKLEEIEQMLIETSEESSRAIDFRPAP